MISWLMLLITKYIGYGMMGTYHFFLRLLIHLRVLRRRSEGGVSETGVAGRRAGGQEREAGLQSFGAPPT